jgi:hypothetical protein
MTFNHSQHRAGKVNVVVICVLTGAACLTLGGLCGGGMTMMLVVRPAQRQIEQAMAEREAVEAEAAHLGKAADVDGNVLGSPLPKGSTETADTKASEASARTVFENIRAGRPQALFKRCSAEFRQITMPDSIQQQLAKYPLPPRTEALGADLQTLPPIDDNTHQYCYSTKTVEGRLVTFTITMVFASATGYGASEWLLDQLTITEGTAEKELLPPTKSP